jgi:hypothetical protein
MSESASVLANVSTAPAVSVRSGSVPWYAWACTLAAVCAVVGLMWDISWHMSIGRDTFWTPAHLVIQCCAILGGISCVYLILQNTFRGSAEAREASVRVWGFYGPLGAFIAAWGGVAMLTSAPFDNWWHNAYGLDVQILSPPHTLLGLGITGVELGGLILILGCMNRATGELRRNLEVLFLLTGGMILTQRMIFFWEYESRVLMHSAIFYRVVCIGAPIVLVTLGWASGRRWASTIAAGVYMAVWLAMLWILPLFAAQPKLGPVYQHVTHMVPMGFPILIIFPAAALDLLWPRMKGWNHWAQAGVAGVAFFAVLVAVQWPFADLLMSPASRNWIFGTQEFAFMQAPADPEVRNVFDYYENSRLAFWGGMALAPLCAILSARIGIAVGGWMRRVRR